MAPVIAPVIRASLVCTAPACAALVCAALVCAALVCAAPAAARRPSTIVEQAKLAGSTETAKAGFGFSVALSADGNTAIVGAPAQGAPGTATGAAWVFTRSGSSWAQQAELPATGESGSYLSLEFGTSVALSSDGSTALVGSPSNASDAGAVWVFTRSGSTWTQQARLTADNEYYDCPAGYFGPGSPPTPCSGFGGSVALSGDGDTALIGGAGQGDSGAAWVFTRAGSTWTQGQTLTGAGKDPFPGFSRFGSSVALSTDGNTALIGAPSPGTLDSAESSPGAAFVFTKSGSTWSQQGPKLTGGGETNGIVTGGEFGAAVALASDGDTALIGGPQNANGDGAAWVFTRSGTSWSQQGSRLTAGTTGAASALGWSVALSSNGNSALVGAQLANDAAGAGWLFTRSGASWSAGSELIATGDAGSTLGYSSALSGDGTTALLGGPSPVFTEGIESDDSFGSGAAWVFGLPSPPSGAAPGNTSAPAVSGTAKAGKRLTCSTGSWTNDPTRYAYQWNFDGTAIPGQTTSSYKVQSVDEGLTLSCTVTASNATGAGKPATSKGVNVPVPKVKRCPAATGKLSGTTLGLLRLGMTRAQARHAYRKSSTRGFKYKDFFCLTPNGVRDGYGSPALVKTLPRSQRKRYSGRVIWISTSNSFFAVGGIRPRAALSLAERKLKLEAPFHIGLNYWYLGPDGASIAVLKVRHGVVEEIGIGVKALNTGRKAQRAFLTSFS